MQPTLSGLVSEKIASPFASGISQHARLLTLRTAQSSDLAESLAVERFSGQEAVNALFFFDIDALSLSTHLELEPLLGEEITLRLLQADGTQRAWHGYCTNITWLGADGGMARYRLRLEPFLAFLRMRRDSYLFQEKTVQQIVTDLMAEHPQANILWNVTQALTQRPLCAQYRESDLDFFTRLLASEGLNWRFNHIQEGHDGEEVLNNQQNGNNTGSLHARHQLVIFDSTAATPPMPGGYDRIRFHRVAATEQLDAIAEFRACVQQTPNAATLTSWHPQQLHAIAAQANISAGDRPDGQPCLEIFDGNGERRFDSAMHAGQHTQRVLHALMLERTTYPGAGAVRQLSAGHSFQLTQHESYPEGNNGNSTFKVLQVQHAAVNNLEPGLSKTAPAYRQSPRTLQNHLETQDPNSPADLTQLEPGTYRNHFVCVHEAVPLVPRATGLQSQNQVPTGPGPQTAHIVGLVDTHITTERDHRIKLQFPWQRGLAPTVGGLFETGNRVDSQGNAPGSEASGTWVRVAEAASGPNWGTQFTPRIDTEVLVNFTHGDIDRPTVLGQLFNGADLPPFSAGVDSGVNHIGTLSGWHSHGLDGRNYNQWVVDDTTRQLRMRLASSMAASQLNLGYLIQQAPTSAQRGRYRGQGFELRTDGWGAVRGADGVLLSTHGRAQQGTSVTSTQMDAVESAAQLKGAQALDQALLDAAAHQTALRSTDTHAAHARFIGQIDTQDQGRHPGTVQGQQTLKPLADSRDADAAQPVEKFASPLVLMESPSSVHWASPASSALFAGQHLQWTTQGDTHWAAGATLSQVSGAATGLFSHSGGIQAYAGNGPLSLQAHTDALEILADQAVTVISVNGHIRILAQSQVSLQAGQSALVLDGGDIRYTCPGTWKVEGAEHAFGGPGSKAGELPVLPTDLAQMKNWIEINHRDEDALAMAGQHYKIFFENGQVISGVLDSQGHARHEGVPNKALRVEYEPRTPENDASWDKLDKLVSATAARLSK